MSNNLTPYVGLDLREANDFNTNSDGSTVNVHQANMMLLDRLLSNIMKRVQVTVTGAQLCNLKNVLPPIVPAPADPTQRIVPCLVHVQYVPGTTPFGNVSVPGFRLVYGANNTNAGIALANAAPTSLGMSALVAKEVPQFPGFAAGVLSSLLVGQGLFLGNLAASDLTLGDGSLVITFWYLTL